MAEKFENLDNILRHWAKEKIQKSSVDALTGTRSRRKKTDRFFFRKWLRKNTRAISVDSRRARLNQKQNWSPNYLKSNKLSRLAN